MELKRWWNQRCRYNPTERMHAHPRNLLSATFKLPFLIITFAGAKPSNGFYVCVEVGVALKYY
ncbi:MAG: hypothetical protein JRE65_11060 [Deltaproteobacteria bacterium]|nr:hypothetical protein [Deltaproteobacteria bacterium]